jgi:hypothetical protein
VSLYRKALDILFSLADLFDERIERKGWSFLSEESLQRIWDNEEDVDQRLRRALEL